MAPKRKSIPYQPVRVNRPFRSPRPPAAAPAAQSPYHVPESSNPARVVAAAAAAAAPVNASAIPKKKAAPLAPTPGCLEVKAGKDRWYGLAAGAHIPVDLIERLKKKLKADQVLEWTDYKNMHITVLPGITDEKMWSAVKADVDSSGIDLSQIMIAPTPYMVQRLPTKENPDIKAYIVAEVISPELNALKYILHKKYTPTKESPSPSHITLVTVKPPLSNTFEGPGTVITRFQKWE